MVGLFSRENLVTYWTVNRGFNNLDRPLFHVKRKKMKFELLTKSKRKLQNIVYDFKYQFCNPYDGFFADLNVVVYCEKNDVGLNTYYFETFFKLPRKLLFRGIPSCPERKFSERNPVETLLSFEYIEKVWQYFSERFSNIKLFSELFNEDSATLRSDTSALSV